MSISVSSTRHWIETVDVQHQAIQLSTVGADLHVIHPVPILSVHRRVCQRWSEEFLLWFSFCFNYFGSLIPCMGTALNGNGGESRSTSYNGLKISLKNDFMVKLLILQRTTFLFTFMRRKHSTILGRFSAAPSPVILSIPSAAQTVSSMAERIISFARGRYFSGPRSIGHHEGVYTYVYNYSLYLYTETISTVYLVLV